MTKYITRALYFTSCHRCHDARRALRLEGATAAALTFHVWSAEKFQMRVNAITAHSFLRLQIAAAARKDVERYDWRESTKQVRRDGYCMAIRLWRQAQKARQSWQSWLPWSWFTKVD
jgi:hypothetical protein